MDLKKFDKQLAKLNKLYSFISEEGGADEVELDLLRSYVKKLAITLGDEVENKVVEPKTKSSSKKQAKKAEAVVEKEEIEIIEEVEEIPEVDESEEELVEVVEEAPKVEAEVIKEVPAKKSTTKKTAKAEKSSSSNGKDQMADLFSTFSSKELGDKLSQMPIKDLTKALSINEKIFTIKELFGGDSDMFRSTLKEMDALSTFDEAKNYLMKGAASKYDWTDEQKFKKARNFIKIVKRRYN